jgi:hypothetical protein
VDPAKRPKAEQIMKHSWFECVDWDKVLAKGVKPPFTPKLSSSVDLRYFDQKVTEEPIKSRSKTTTVKGYIKE